VLLRGAGLAGGLCVLSGGFARCVLRTIAYVWTMCRVVSRGNAGIIIVMAGAAAMLAV
jgi:hypothetical protein